MTLNYHFGVICLYKLIYIKRLNGGIMRKLSKLLLALSFVVSVTSSAFAVTVASWGGAYTASQKQGYRF